MIEIPRDARARYLRTCRWLALLCAATAGFYLWWLVFDARAANPYLFGVLMAAEGFNLIQAAGFWYTIATQRWTDPPDADFTALPGGVDVFITVCGEPADVVEPTVRAAAAIRHPSLKVWVLDDDPAPAIEAIALRHGARYVTRKDRTGAKAGNLNHALSLATGAYFAVFDADHMPSPSFLERTMACFLDRRVAFVQTPQSYRNRGVNRVSAGAEEQQALFYGPILRGKDRAGAVFSCGTNVVMRRSAVDAVGGIPEDSVTEDLRLSLVLVRAGWTSAYVSEVLAEGLGPVDVSGYFAQQMRWARGGLEILFRSRPFYWGMGPRRALQYFLSFLYWFTGWAYAGYMLLPLAFLFGGLRPVQVPNQYPIHFLPYVFATLLTMAYASGFTLRFRALWFTLAAFPVHMTALFAAIFGRARQFVVTFKGKGRRSLGVVWPQAAMLTALLVAAGIGLIDHGPTPSVANNAAFALGHILILQGFIVLAWNPEARAQRARGGVPALAPVPATVLAPVPASAAAIATPAGGKRAWLPRPALLAAAPASAARSAGGRGYGHARTLGALTASMGVALVLASAAQFVSLGHAGAASPVVTPKPKTVASATVTPSVPATPAASAPTTTAAPATASPAPVAQFPLSGKVEAPASGAYLGVYDPPAPFDLKAVDSFASAAGKGVSIVMWYQPWASGNRSDFDAGACSALMQRGVVPMITWEAWDPGSDAKALTDPVNQPAFRLSTIVSGKYDEYIRGWADQIRQLGGPVMLRPLHEMNGNWYPWGGTVNGNTPALYVAAWRHIHDLFDKEGATNVTWVWSINHESVPSGRYNSPAAYWPGDRYVDWTAISGFNWGTAGQGTKWHTFQSWYASPLAYLKTLHKPICIAEVGSVEQGGNKAAWLTDTYRQLQQTYPAVRAMVYYNAIDRLPGSTQDWRIDTSPASLRAFRRAVAPGYFVPDAPPALSSWENLLSPDQKNYLSGLVPTY
jgi:cellulose synthase (UDP-forming)